MKNETMKILLFTALLALGLPLAAVPTGSYERGAASLSVTTKEQTRTITLTSEYYPAEDGEAAYYDEDSGVYYCKAKLKKGTPYVFWSTVEGTNSTLMLSDVYEMENTDEDDEYVYPSFNTLEVGTSGYCYITEDDWDEEDAPSSWVYYIAFYGDVGETCTLHYQQADINDILPTGSEAKPEALALAAEKSSESRTCPDGESYYFTVQLEAGQSYRFHTLNGSAENNTYLELNGDSTTALTMRDVVVADDADNKTLVVRADETGTCTLIVGSASGEVEFEYWPVTVGSVGFTVASTTVTPSDAEVSIVVSRTSSDLAYSLFCGTVPMTAKGGHEYAATSNVLSFVEGELEKTIVVPLYWNRHGGEADGREFALRMEMTDDSEYDPEITRDVTYVKLSDSRTAGTDSGADEDENFGFTTLVAYDGNGCAPTQVPTSKKHYTGTMFTVAEQGEMEREGWEFRGWTSSDSRTYESGKSYYVPPEDLALTARWSMVTNGLPEALDCDCPFEATGSGPWVRDYSVFKCGDSSLRSSELSSGGTATLTTTVTGQKVLSLLYKTSCSSASRLTVTVDGTTVLTATGIADWKNLSHTLAGAGAHTIVISYAQGSTSAGQNCAWIDQLLLAEAATVTLDTSVPQDSEAQVVYADATSLTLAVGALVGELPEPTCATWTFDGWKTPDGENAATAVVPRDGLQLHATWREKEWTITYDLNGGTGTVPDSRQLVKNSVINLPTEDGSFARAGYELAGWSTEATGGAVLHQYTVGPSDATLYAQWTFSVRDIPAALDSDSEYDVITPTFSVSGDSPWFAQSDVVHSSAGDGTALECGSGTTYLTITADLPSDGFISFYAYRTGVVYISVDGENEHLMSSLIPNTCTWTKVEYALPKGNHVITIKSTFAQRIRLDDLVIGCRAEVGFVSGKEDASFQTTNVTYLVGGFFEEMPRPTAQEDTFFCWTNRAGKVYSEDDLVTLSATNMTLYARWLGYREYTVSFDVSSADGEPETPPSQSERVGGRIPLPFGQDYGLANEGSAFGGWTLDGVESYPEGSFYEVGASNVTFSAYWIRLRTLTFLDGGAPGVVPDAVHTNNGETLYLPYPEGLCRSGYAFVGWEDASGRIWTTNELYKVPAVDVNLTAHWEMSTTEIESTFNQKGVTYILSGYAPWYVESEGVVRSGEVPNSEPKGTESLLQIKVQGKGSLSFDYKLVNRSYKFKASIDGGEPSSDCDWTTKTCEFVDDGTHLITLRVYKSSDNSLGESAILRIRNLVWKPEVVTVSFAASAGSGAFPDAQEVSPNSTLTLPGPGDLSYAGYRFVGWTDGTATYCEGDLYPVGTGDVSLTAVWEEVPPSTPETAAVTFVTDLAGASFATSNVTLTVDEPFGTLPVPTADGYAFLDWTNAVGAVLSADAIVETADDGCAYYASWEKLGPSAPIIGGEEVALEEMASSVNSATSAILDAASASLDGNELAYGGETVVFPDYYKVTLSAAAGGQVTLTVALDETKAMPVVDTTVEEPFSVAEGTVSLSVANVKAGLWYALEETAKLGVDFEPIAATWRQAKTDGEKLTLSTAAAGSSGFYRIVVTDLAPEK